MQTAVEHTLCHYSGGGDTEVCCVDTVLSDAVGGGLCDIDRVSGGGVVWTRWCRLLSVSRGVTVVCVGDVSVSGGGELDVGVSVSGVDESVCGVNSVMTAGELDV